MHLPDYEGGSIVNLMSSIGSHFGLTPMYDSLRALPNKGFDDCTNIVLVLLDGLGQEYIGRHKKGSFISRHADSHVTSVFPTTTSAVLTSIATGLAPQQHAVTGWFMYLKEVGMVTKILPFTPRMGTIPLSISGVHVSDVIRTKMMFDMLPVECHCVIKEDIYDSDYSRLISSGSKRAPYRDLSGFISNIEGACNSGESRKFVYAYWSHFDTLSHTHGVDSEATHAHFDELDAAMEGLCASLEGTNTCLLVTADHGQIDVTAETALHLRDHPGLYNCLTLPLCGESRAPYCYVRPSLASKFEKYVEGELSDVCTMRTGAELIEEGYFGLFEPNMRLFDRIGDYVLLMKENYVLRDRLLGEAAHTMVGYHGGLSDDELYVPLVALSL